jgi:signal transduction histidine kinase
MLTGLKMNLESLRNDSLNGIADASRFDGALKILSDSMSEMRRVAHHLMPDALSRFGLKTSVSDFCDTLSSVKFLWFGDETRLNPKTEEMIYRTVHELVNNALKHARASQILVQIIQEPNRLAFTVQDDGCGFDPETVTEGMGLQNIRTRVASFGGIMHIASKAGEGTETNVELRVES